MLHWARLVAALAVSAVATGPALAGEHVEWLDDGTVLLRLGPAYDDAVIETSRDELGTLFGPDQQPFKGQQVTILTHDEGDKGPISGPILAFSQVFSELGGAAVQVDRVPIGELYAAAMLDLQRGDARYDAIVVPAFTYGDLIAGDYLRAVDDLNASGRFPRWSYDAMPASLRGLHAWNGVGYGVPNDADGQILYYRRDILSDPKWQAAFKEAAGYDLPVPPRSWQQVLDIARFFDGKSWDDGDSQPEHGMVLHLKQGEQAHFHFQALAASFAIPTGADGEQARGQFWFDPETMRPLINGPGQVAALELLAQLNELGPPEQIGWRLPQAWEYYLRGKALMMFSFGDLGPLCQDSAGSTLKGRCGAAVLPGSTRAWDGPRNAWVDQPDPQPVGNTVGGSWHGVVSKQARNPEGAYAFLSLMAIPPVSSWNARTGWTGVNPGFKYQLLPPEGTGRLADYIKAGWDRTDVEDYLRAYAATFNAPTMLPYLRIRGTPEYWSVLDTQLAAAMGGRKTPKEALDATAAAWEEITDRLGRQQQLDAYRSAIGLTPGSG